MQYFIFIYANIYIFFFFKFILKDLQGLKGKEENAILPFTIALLYNVPLDLEFKQN